MAGCSSEPVNPLMGILVVDLAVADDEVVAETSGAVHSEEAGKHQRPKNQVIFNRAHTKFALCTDFSSRFADSTLRFDIGADFLLGNESFTSSGR